MPDRPENHKTPVRRKSLVAPSRRAPRIPAALVTGGARRLGRETALFLAKKGYAVALHYHRSSEAACRTRDIIFEAGGAARLFRANLQDRRQVSTLIERVLRVYPNLELIVHNASVFEKASLLKSEAALFERAFALHVEAPFILTRDFARKKRRGQIVAFLDTRVSRNKSAYFAYTLSKKTLAAFTRMAAAELGPRIRVNGIAPGLILPPEGKSSRYLDRLASKIPLKRRGRVEEVLECLNFLIQNPYVTGQILYPDGGENL